MLFPNDHIPEKFGINPHTCIQTDILFEQIPYGYSSRDCFVVEKVPDGDYSKAFSSSMTRVLCPNKSVNSGKLFSHLLRESVDIASSRSDIEHNIPIMRDFIGINGKLYLQHQDYIGKIYLKDGVEKGIFDDNGLPLVMSNEYNIDNCLFDYNDIDMYVSQDDNASECCIKWSHSKTSNYFCATGHGCRRNVLSVLKKVKLLCMGKEYELGPVFPGSMVPSSYM